VTADNERDLPADSSDRPTSPAPVSSPPVLPPPAVPPGGQPAPRRYLLQILAGCFLLTVGIAIGAALPHDDPPATVPAAAAQATGTPTAVAPPATATAPAPSPSHVPDPLGSSAVPSAERISAAPPAKTEPPAPVDEPLVFEATGAGRAMITYIDADFQIGQHSDTALPWRKSFTHSAAGMNFSAQRLSDDAGTVSCRIRRGSRTIASNSSSGPYAIVGCTL
jgi:hypothetical protein